MPEPAVLRRHSVGGETIVSHGRGVVFRYGDDDVAMRNLAVVALTDAGTPGIEVAATFGLSAEYVRGCVRVPGGTVRPGWWSAAAARRSCPNIRCARSGGGRDRA